MFKPLKPLFICLLLSAVMACTQGLQLPSGQPTAATNIDIDDEEEGTELAATEPLANPAEDRIESPFAEEAPAEAVTRSVESRRISAPHETTVTIAESDGTTTAPSSHESVQCMATLIISWPNATRPEGIPDSGFNHKAYCSDTALIPASALFSDDFARQAQIRNTTVTFVEDDTVLCRVGQQCVRKNALAEDLGLTAGYHLIFEIVDCDAHHRQWHKRNLLALFLRDGDIDRFKDARALQKYTCVSTLRFVGDAYVPKESQYKIIVPRDYLPFILNQK